MRRIVVVGASLAGVHAAEALRERDYDGELTLVSAEARLPYDRPPISKELLLGTMESEQLLLRPESWYHERGVELRLGAAARGLDPAARTIALADGSELAYDGLILATGSTARRLPAVPDGPTVHVLRDLDHALALRPALQPGKHLVVIGGGFIGLEVAGVARRLGLDVTLVENSPIPLVRAFGSDTGDWYRRLHERNGVQFVHECAIDSIGTNRGGTVLGLSDGSAITGDIVVAGIGSIPSIDWLAGSGVALSGGVLCTPDLATSAPGVVAAGDIARWHNPIFGQEMRVEHWSNAVDQGRHAAATLLGDRSPFASVPYFWTDQHDTKMRFVGRAAGATDTRVELISDDKLVVTYGRDGVLIGAVCVGAPRQLAKYKVAIQNRVPWEDAAESQLASTV
ncbi:NAD(P)/FAD-dependent oxidoreductase [Leucobacter triazinivorans]|nr:FAD-dependent oxidoreductase [Leucobacter triazinivorans]